MHDRPTEKGTTAKRLLLLGASLTVGAIAWFMLGESESLTAAETPQHPQKVLAKVGDVMITEQQIQDALAGQLLKMDRERHQLISRAVGAEVRNVLLDAEATERGITREEYVAAEVDGKLSEVAAEKVDAFFEARKQQIRGTKEQLEPQIRRFIRFEELIAELRNDAEIELLIEPFRVGVETTGPSKGAEDAPVTIVEFSDFECPFCSQVNPALDKIQETYGDKVRVVFRQYPLEIHKNARKAGEASLCAHDQGKFWEMHDAMFADQKNLGVDGLKTIAASIAELDSEAFGACLDSGKYASTVEDDLRYGTQVGVTSTPSFFINGRFVSGAQPFETFAEIIDDELGREESVKGSS